MSSGASENRSKLLEEFARELRQLNGLGTSFFRIAAARTGMTDTDIQVIDLLDSGGPMSAGQLADLTGLTTGAITAMLNRLEVSGIVQRERDPGDGRRVIVRLAKENEAMRQIEAVFTAMTDARSKLATPYPDEQLALLVKFLKQNNTLSRQEFVRWREGFEDKKEQTFTPLGDLKMGKLVVSSGLAKLTVRAGEEMAELYQAHLDDPAPEVKVKEGTVTVRYPKRLWPIGGGRGEAEIILNNAIPWEIVIQGGLATVNISLTNLELAGLELKGGLSQTRVELPVPRGVVPVKISGGATDVIVRRPAGTAARVHLKGWASEFIFDEKTFDNLGNDVRMESPGFNYSGPHYEFEVSSSASQISITTS